MLASLSIRDVVLIDKLDLDFQDGLCVLTGETGAGKSILLDSLGLALGARAESRLVRAGCRQASVSASFDIESDHAAWVILAEQGMIAEDDGLIVRRTLNNDGRSKAFINGAPISVGVLRRLGEALVEIHGQFESQRLMHPSEHRGLLDAFGGHGECLDIVDADYRAWRKAEAERIAAEESLAEARRDEEYLRYALDELRAIGPEKGEEEALARKRQVMMRAEGLVEALCEAQKALDNGDGVEGSLRRALRVLERVAEKAEGRFDGVIETLDRAAAETAEGIALLSRTASDMDTDPKTLETTEERLFALRKLARKHNVAVDGLGDIVCAFEEQLATLDQGGASLERLSADARAARAAFVESAHRLSKARERAAEKLNGVVAAELDPLKMGGARFVVRVQELDENDWNAFGRDRVVFEVSTNPGEPPGPMNKIASGGERSRFMLALKVALANADPVPTLVFDEVDSGIGGATAAAVGDRLAALAESAQVLVVTHSPQVAARGARHWRVEKESAPGEERMETKVSVLGDKDRATEIARMLAGAKITPEAEAAALSLLRGTVA